MQITIIDTAIRQDEHGRYSLNDLHRAAMAAAGRGGNPNDDHQRPGCFFESAGVQDFVAALNAENPAVSAVASIPGRKGGTYAAELVVYRYAAWISPAFEVMTPAAAVPAQARPARLSYLQVGNPLFGR